MSHFLAPCSSIWAAESNFLGKIVFHHKSQFLLHVCPSCAPAIDHCSLPVLPGALSIRGSFNNCALLQGMQGSHRPPQLTLLRRLMLKCHMLRHRILLGWPARMMRQRPCPPDLRLQSVAMAPPWLQQGPHKETLAGHLVAVGIPCLPVETLQVGSPCTKYCF